MFKFVCISLLFLSQAWIVQTLKMIDIPSVPLFFLTNLYIYEYIYDMTFSKFSGLGVYVFVCLSVRVFELRMCV